VAEGEEIKNGTLNTTLIISLGIALLFLIASIVVLSLVPPVSRDALIHHLAVPKLYLKNGIIYEIPFLKSSYYPMNLDLLYLIPLYFGNDIGPKIIHFLFALLTAWLIFRFLRFRISTTYGLLGVLFFLSIPIVVKLSITAYVDLGLIFFSTASLFLVIKWAETEFKYKYLILSGLFCGLALGTKYNALISLFILALFVPYLQSRYGKGEKKKIANILLPTVFFSSVALIIFSPWMIKNFVWTGNPIFPLYNSFFNEVDIIRGKGFDPFTVRRILFNESWWEMVLLPLRIFFQGQDDSPQYFDGRLNPFLLFFSFFAFWFGKNDTDREKRERMVFLFFSLIFFGFAFFSTGVRIRYISPIIPALVILSIYGIRNMIRVLQNLEYGVSKTFGILFISVMVIYPFWVNGVYIFDQFKKVNPISYLSGDITRDKYIEKYRPEYSAIKFINKNLPANSKILLIFVGKRGYYLDRDYEAGIDIFEKIMKSSASEDEILGKLRKGEITHFLLRHNLFLNWVNNNMDEEKKALLNKVFQHDVKLIFKKSGYILYKLETG
jgi:hypothetical protein